MDEPPSKKSRAESDFDEGDGLDALSALEKLEPLPTSTNSDADNASTSAGGSGGPSGATPQQSTPQSVQNTSGFNMAPGSSTSQIVPPASTSSGSSVLQELLMNQPQGNNNSPRPNAGYPPGQPNAFTRSPLMHNGNMMSPPNNMVGRVPGPSPGGPQPGPGNGPQIRPGQPPMFPPGSAEASQMMMQHQNQQYPQMMHRGYPPYGQPGAPNAGQIAAQGYPGAGRGGPTPGAGMGRGQMMNGAAMAARNGAMAGQGRGVMPGQQQQAAQQQMMAQYGQQFVQRPDQFMQYGRGQHPQYHMMHPQPMMMDSNGQPMRPPNGQLMMMNGNHPGMPQHGAGAGPASAAAQQAAAQQQAQVQAQQQAQQAQMKREQEAQAAAAAAAQRNGAGRSTPGGLIPTTQDPEKRKLIQQQLVLLLHAHKCSQRERENRESVSRNQPPPHAPCTLPHCSTMKEVLQHMTSCNVGRGCSSENSQNQKCSVAHCASSRQIIAHWKNCLREDCPVCKPLKKIQDTPLQFSSVPEIVSLIGGGGNSSNNNGDSEGMGQFGSPNARAGNFPTLFEGYNGDPFLQLNAPNQKLPSSDSMSRGPGELHDLPPPEVPNADKEWHLQVTKDLRNHLVGKLVKAIFPEPDPHVMHDNRLKDLIAYARKVEKEMFESANDREEYYHLLAEKIYKIQKELQEKKNSRLSQGLGIAHDPYNHIPAAAELDEMMGGTQDAAVAPHQGNQPNGQPWFQMNGPGQNQLPSTSLVKQEPMDESDTLSSRPTTGFGNGTTSNTPMTNGIKKEEIASPSASNQGTSEVKKEEDDGVKREPTPPPCEDTVFTADEIRNFLMPVWEKVDGSEDAAPFRIPVDTVSLGIPDYHDIVKYPMDLSTIQKKIDNGKYKNAWQFVDDVWLMFDNAWLYNKKNSKVYKFGTKLSEYFTAIMDPVMKAMGYCCSRKLSFTPLSLFCYGAAMCTIARDQSYWVYETNSTQFNVTVTERYTYCQKCFDNLPPEGISLSENPNDRNNMAPKEKFVMLKNNLIDMEPFEKCKYCQRKWHRICALHDKKVYPEGFVCESCRVSKKYPKPENKFVASKLPTNHLSTFLEDRVNNYIKKQLVAEAHKYQVVIRTLCVQDKEVEVKPQMKARYCQPDGEKFPEKFPYRTKAVFAFEIIDGVEVCFFGLHVQEYGSECPAPNARRVYIAYLDSVHFFQPRELRTDVYHEILLGYLDYAKTLGYTMAHIWACPPSEGDDYIFHCHPPEQKIPKPKRLQDWYKKMLEKGVTEGTVVEFKDIYKQARDDHLTSPAHLPYFEGDFWPNVIEDCIREATNEEAQRKVKEDNDDDPYQDDIVGLDGKKKSSKQSKKNSLKKNSKANKKKQGIVTGNEVCDKLYSHFDKHKEVFFTIRLVTTQAEAVVLKKAIEDPDTLLPSEMMDGRDTFLTRARDEHWEFSSLRRAKYSTLCLTHALHEADSSKNIEYTCNKCSSVAKWHCNSCEDFDLCDPCYAATKHEHPLEAIKSLIPDSNTEGGKPGSGNRYESIQRCIASLVHACQCRDANCRRMSCHKMKRVVQHTKLCKKRVNGTCPVCKQLIALCCYHAKHCVRDNCLVPFCMNIRQKLAEQKRSIQRRSDMMMRRRMEGLQAGAGGGMAAPSTSSVAVNPAPATPTGGPGSTATPPLSAGGPMSAKGGGVGQVNNMAMNQQQPGRFMPNHMMTQQQQQQNSFAYPGPQGNNQQQQPNFNQNPQNPNDMMRYGMQYGKGNGPVGNNQPSPHFPGQMGRPGMPNMNAAQQQQQQGRPGMPQQGGPNNVYSTCRQGGYMDGVHSMGPSGSNSGSQQQQQAQQQQQQQQQQVNLQDPAQQAQIMKINARMKAAKSVEERESVFADLKKTPHLFNAWLRTNGQQMYPQMNGMPNNMMPQPRPGQPPAFSNANQPRGPGGQFASLTPQQQAWQRQQQQQMSQGMPPMSYNQNRQQQQMMMAQQQQQMQQQQHHQNAGQ